MQTSSPVADTEVSLEENVHHVNTLDPSKLTREDYVDISGLEWPSESFTLATERDPTRVKEGVETFVHPFQRFGKKNAPKVQLPDRTAGFFYLQEAPEGAPMTAAEVRMRITNDPDPSSFANGTDLVQNGLPWRQPILKCNYAWLLSLVRRDDSLSKAAQARLLRFNRAKTDFTRHFKNTSTMLYSRSQPFVIDFSRVNLRLALLHAAAGRDFIRLMNYQLPKKARSTGEDEASNASDTPVSSEGKESRHRYEPLYTGMC